MLSTVKKMSYHLPVLHIFFYQITVNDRQILRTYYTNQCINLKSQGGSIILFLMNQIMYNHSFSTIDLHAVDTG